MMAAAEVPEVVVSRLPQYLRILNRLMEDGTMVVSSQQLGEKLQVTPAQIRKDLSYFGQIRQAGAGIQCAGTSLTACDRFWG